MKAFFINTPNGFAFEFPEFILPQRVIELTFSRYVLLRLRTELANFSGKTVNLRVWDGSGQPGTVLFVDHDWATTTGYPLVRKVEAVHGLTFHTALSDLTFPESGVYSIPSQDELQREVVLLR